MAGTKANDSLGNSWRTANDGSGWAQLTNAINRQAEASFYSGSGGWADPDLLIGPQVYVGGQSDQQARAQFTLWCIFPANLLLSQDVLTWSPYALETYSNAELIAINKDPLRAPARRVSGDDLQFPCRGQYTAGTEAAPCNASDPFQLWRGNASAGTFESAAFPGALLTSSVCNSGYEGLPVVLASASQNGACPGGGSKHWHANSSDGSLRNNGQCLDVGGPQGTRVDTAACTAKANQAWTLRADGTLASQSGICVRAKSWGNTCSNVWGRRLVNESYSLAFVNNDDVESYVTCDGACFAALNITPGTAQLRVRDLWTHAEVAVLKAPFEFRTLVGAGGAASAFKLTPA